MVLKKMNNMTLQHIENIVPELGPFFDRLVNPLDPEQFTVSEALSRFMDIYDKLSASQLQEPVHTWVWLKGRTVAIDTLSFDYSGSNSSP